jgi:hypothetical protein
MRKLDAWALEAAGLWRKYMQKETLELPKTKVLCMVYHDGWQDGFKEARKKAYELIGDPRLLTIGEDDE